MWREGCNVEVKHVPGAVHLTDLHHVADTADGLVEEVALHHYLGEVVCNIK
jgi:hypothetical protein